MQPVAQVPIVAQVRHVSPGAQAITSEPRQARTPAAGHSSWQFPGPTHRPFRQPREHSATVAQSRQPPAASQDSAVSAWQALAPVAGQPSLHGGADWQAPPSQPFAQVAAATQDRHPSPSRHTRASAPRQAATPTSGHWSEQGPEGVEAPDETQAEASTSNAQHRECSDAGGAFMRTLPPGLQRSLLGFLPDAIGSFTGLQGAIAKHPPRWSRDPRQPVAASRASRTMAGISGGRHNQGDLGNREGA